MIIECANCEAKVGAKVSAEHESMDEDIGPLQSIFFLIMGPSLRLKQ